MWDSLACLIWVSPADRAAVVVNRATFRVGGGHDPSGLAGVLVAAILDSVVMRGATAVLRASTLGEACRGSPIG
jgi:hypothetical protein